MVLKPHRTVAAQAKGFHIQSLDHGLPLADMDATLGHHRFLFSHNSDIGGGTAHVHDHRIVPGCQSTAAYNTGRRSAKQCLHRALSGHLLRHQASVASHNRDRYIQPPFFHHMPHRFHKLGDQRDQAGIQHGSRTGF